MKWLTNMYNPMLPDAKMHIARYQDESLEQAWEREQKYLKGKIIGELKAGHFTVEQLKEAGMVGIYVND